MNERIRELAHEAGLPTYNPEGVPTKLEKFAELVAAHEREECAALMFRLDLCGEEMKAAEAIRARG